MEVNGRPVFVRGTNLLPTYWLSEYSPERVDRDFEMLRAAGFNAVLIHNLVAPRCFYEGANRNGFLVVQMFPLQWSYDQSHEMVERMTTQVRAMAGLLFNEPSVVSYEVHNEPDMRTFEDIDNRFFDFDLHATLDVKHSIAWIAEAIAPAVAEDPRRARAIAEGALIRLTCGARCFERYRQELW